MRSCIEQTRALPPPRILEKDELLEYHSAPRNRGHTRRMEQCGDTRFNWKNVRVGARKKRENTNVFNVLAHA